LRTGTGEGKFLSCDKHGLVAADREARGPQEEWTPVILEGGMVAFMNVYDKYLGVDEVAGGQLVLRGDSDTAGFQERFYVKIQNKYKQEAHEEERKKGGELDQPSMDEKGTKWVLEFVHPPVLSYPAVLVPPIKLGVQEGLLFQMVIKKR
jgi:protein FRG1